MRTASYTPTPCPTGTRQSSLEFSLHSDNAAPTGIWSNGTTIWVADFFDRKLYAYKFTTGADFGDRDSAKDINTLSAAGNNAPTGIWSDGTTMWVADNGDDQLYAYKLTPGGDFGDRDSAKDINTLSAAGNANPRGMWSDGTTMWVSDFTDKKLYAYALSDGTRNSGREFNTLDDAGNDNSTAIWSDGTTMWAVNNGANESDKAFSYHMPAAPVHRQGVHRRALHPCQVEGQRPRRLRGATTTRRISVLLETLPGTNTLEQYRPTMCRPTAPWRCRRAGAAEPSPLLTLPPNI